MVDTRDNVVVRVSAENVTGAERELVRYRKTYEAATSGAAASSKRAEAAITRSNTAISSSISDLTSKVPGLSSGMLAVGLAGGAAALAIKGFGFALQKARDAMQWADDTKALSDAIGVSATKFQELEFAAHDANVSSDDLSDGLKKLNGVLGAVKTGSASKDQLAILKSINITPDQLKGMNDASQLLPVLADKIANVGSTAAQVQIAKKLGVEELLPLLRRGGSGIDNLSKSAHDLGVVIDDQTVTALADLNNQVEVAQKRIDTQLKVAFVNLAPAIEGATTAAADFLQFLNQKMPSGDSVGGFMLKFATGNFSGAIGDFEKRLQPEKALGGTVTSDDIRRKFGIAKPDGFTKIPPTARKTHDSTLDQASSALQALDAANKDKASAIAAINDEILVKSQAQKDAIDAELKATLDDVAKKKEKLSADKNFKGDKSLLQAQLDQAATVYELSAAIKRRSVDAEAQISLDQKSLQRHREVAGYEIEQLNAQAQLARTPQERADIEARILEISRNLEDEQAANLLKAKNLRANVATGDNSVVVVDGPQKNAAKTAARAAEDENVRRAGLGPLAAWVQANVDAAKTVNNAYEEIAVEGLNDFNQSLADALVGAQDFGQAFTDVLKHIAAQIAAMELAKIETGILSLLSGGGRASQSGINADSEGSFSFNSLSGARATGGPVRAGGAYLVGEKRPEVFVPNTSGKIVPSVGQYAKSSAMQRPGGGGTHIYAPLVQISADSGVVSEAWVQSQNQKLRQARDSAVDMMKRALPDQLKTLNAFGTT